MLIISHGIPPMMHTQGVTLVVCAKSVHLALNINQEHGGQLRVFLAAPNYYSSKSGEGQTARPEASRMRIHSSIAFEMDR
jgi:hypothetical protein